MIPGKDTSQVSHPPHLTSVWSSALIPFCAYETNLNISRNRLSLPGLTFPLCSSFLPTILEGQLCSKLTLNTTSGQGKRNELMLLLDYNEERSLQTSAEENKPAKLIEDTQVEYISLNFFLEIQKYQQCTDQNYDLRPYQQTDMGGCQRHLRV